MKIHNINSALSWQRQNRIPLIGLWFFGILFLLALAGPPEAAAQDWHFQYSTSDGLWSNAANWNPGTGMAPPGTDPNLDFAFINGGHAMTLQAGDTYTINWCSIGHSSIGGHDGTGALTMTGGTLNMTSHHTEGYDELYLGDSRGGTINQSGGVITVGSRAYLGRWYAGGGPDTWTLSGSASATIGAGLRIGYFEQAHVSSENASVTQGVGTTMSVGGDLTLGSINGSANSRTMAYNLNGGTLTVSGVINANAYGTRNFTFNGGTLQAGTTQPEFLSGLNHAYVDIGGAIIDSNGQDIGLNQPLEHSGTGTDGGLTKLGAGTLTLSSVSSSYTGPTIVSNGTLAVRAAGGLSPSTDVYLFMLTGQGTLHLNYSGTTPVHGLFIDGIQQPNGTYSADNAPIPITGPGWLQVGPLPEVSINDVSVTEGDTGTIDAEFTVTLSAPSADTVTVNYATAVGGVYEATPGVDYVAASGQVQFDPGVTTQPILVTVNGDTLFERDETFQVILSSSVNAIIARGTGVGTILNDDPVPPGTIPITNPSFEDPPLADDTTGIPAGWIPSGGWAAWNPKDGQWPGATDGDATASTIPDGRNVYAVAGNGSYITQVLGESYAIGRHYQLGAFVGARGDEGAGYSCNYSIQLLRGDTHEVLAQATGTLNTTDRGAWRQVQVDLEPTSAVAGVPIEIRAYDNGPGAAQFSVDNFSLWATNLTVILPELAINDVSVTEGDSGTLDAEFTVTLSAPSADIVTVNYATAVGGVYEATPGVDYVAASGQVQFDPGVTAQPIIITVIGDTLFEHDETFRVILSSPVNAIIARGAGVGTILNDDILVSSPLSIVNPSFEDPVLADGTDSPSNGAPGWVPGGDYARPWNPRDGQWPGATDGDATPSTIPDGQNAAIIAGGSGGWNLSQVLANTFQAGASYYFIMNAGARLDEGGGYDANYRFQILRGDTHEVLAEEGGPVGASDRGPWKECMVGYVATAGVVGVPIEIRAMNIGPGWQLSVDNARLLENLAGGPRLTIVPSAGSVTLSWPVSFTGYILESATALPATTWTAVAGVVNNSVTLGASAGNGFFRLRKP